MLRAFIIAIALAFVSSAFGQTVVVEEASWWGDVANSAIAAVASVLTVAVPVVSGFLAKLIWNKSRLAGVLLSQRMLDKLNAGIIAMIRAEEERLKQAIKPTSATVAKAKDVSEATPAMKKEIVANVQPKVEVAFKETLEHFGKSGSQVTDMILGRIDQALKPDPVIPFPQNKG